MYCRIALVAVWLTGSILPATAFPQQLIRALDAPDRSASLGFTGVSPARYQQSQPTQPPGVPETYHGIVENEAPLLSGHCGNGRCGECAACAAQRKNVWVVRAGAVFLGRSRARSRVLVQERRVERKKVCEFDSVVCDFDCDGGDGGDACDVCGDCSCGGGGCVCGGACFCAVCGACKIVETVRFIDVFRAQSVDVGFGAGPRISLFRQDHHHRGIELTYFGVSDLDFDESFEGNLRVLGADIGNGVARTTFESRIDSAELNYRQPIDIWSNFLIGVRWFELDETARVVGVGDMLTVDQGMTTRNSLIGVQLGVDADVYDRGGVFHVNTLLKVGAYGNDITLDRRGFLGTDRTDQDVAFLGELQVMGNYQLSTRSFVNVGYQALWLDGVALATQQNPLGAIRTDGTPFFHGLIVSLQYVR